MTTFYGLQVEMDMVYDPSSPVFRSVVIRVNYYNGHKHNLLELAADAKGRKNYSYSF